MSLRKVIKYSAALILTVLLFPTLLIWLLFDAATEDDNTKHFLSSMWLSPLNNKN